MIALLAALLASPQAESRPGWTPPLRSEIPAGDEAYPGTIALEVDARRSAQAIISVRETIPVASTERLTLRYPRWLQANHAPTGQVGAFASLRFTANGRALVWKRDPVDMHAFHVEVPAGVRQVEASSDVVGTGTGREPIRLLVKEGLRIREAPIDYHRGLRWPRLEKVGSGEASIDRMLAPL